MCNQFGAIFLAWIAALAVPVDGNSVETPNESDLVMLARTHFGGLDKISRAEEELFRATQGGRAADFCTHDQRLDEPDNWKSWSTNRYIRADRLEWLCTDRQASEFITYKGVELCGAIITNRLNFRLATLIFPLSITDSVLGDVNFDFCRLQVLNLKGSHLDSLHATGLKVRDNVYLSEGFVAAGEVHLASSKIGGDLNCINGQFLSSTAIVAQRITVNGDVLLRGPHVKTLGKVDFTAASVAGQFSCTGATFDNSNGLALVMESANVTRSVILHQGFTSNGEVALDRATIGGDLDCGSGRFLNPSSTAISAQGVTIKGSVLLRDGFTHGRSDFFSARIEGSFDGTSQEFDETNATVLSLEGATIGESIQFNNSKILGEVNLDHAVVGLNLECIGAQLCNMGSSALIAQSVKITKDVLLRQNFHAQGRVDLVAAKIGGEMDCQDGQFDNLSSIALTIQAASIATTLRLNNIKVSGEVKLDSAAIGIDLECMNSKFSNPGQNALSANGMKVDGTLVLSSDFTTNGLLDLASVKASNLRLPSNLRSLTAVHLDGLVYDRLPDLTPVTLNSVLEWIRTQRGSTNFSRQPYEHLATLLRKSGYDDEAKKVMIAMNDDIRHRGLVLLRPWGYAAKWLVGYGYRPFRALFWSCCILILGCYIFGRAYSAGIICPSDPKRAFQASEPRLTNQSPEHPIIPIWLAKLIEFWHRKIATPMQKFRRRMLFPNDPFKDNLAPDYPCFNVFIFSLENLVPLLSLEIGKDWAPVGDQKGQLGLHIPLTRSFVRGYLYFHIVAGWILTSFWVGGLAGLLKS